LTDVAFFFFDEAFGAAFFFAAMSLVRACLFVSYLLVKM
jgi:hypothetical protein